jgi:hypothetical protein
MLSWLTGKFAAYVTGALLVALLAMSAVVVLQRNVIGRLQAETDLATARLDGAIAATHTAKDTIKSLQAERDAFVLKRAMEIEEAQAIVAQSQHEAAQALSAFLQAKERIRQLSLTANCMAAMAMPVCPAIADELRKAP